MLSFPPGAITASWLSQEWLSSSIYFTLILESVLQTASNSGHSFLFFFFLIHKPFQLTEPDTFQSLSSYLLQNQKPLNCPREGYKRPNANQRAQINRRLNFGGVLNCKDTIVSLLSTLLEESKHPGTDRPGRFLQVPVHEVCLGPDQFRSHLS